jgi:hypothetical protein
MEGEYDKTQACTITIHNASESPSSLCGTQASTCYSARSCRTSYLGDAPGQCGTASENYTSAPGLTYQQMVADPWVSPSTLQCSTLEPMPAAQPRLSESLARIQPSHPFWTYLTASDENEASARNVLVRHAKLLFELGVLGTADELEAARQLYSSAPGEAPTCGESATPEVSPECLPFGENNLLNGPVGLCQRLLSSHVPVMTAWREAGMCYDLASHPALYSLEPCAIEYKNLIDLVNELILAKTS